MASARQVAANQKNARKSTGPRSAKGKSKSRTNALRHGLAAALFPAGSTFEESEWFAQALVSDQRILDSDIIELARVAADAHLQLRLIRDMRAEIASKWRSMSYHNRIAIGLDEQLQPLERYERRALSRRKTALRALSRKFAYLGT